jgi:hypothetical protein
MHTDFVTINGFYTQDEDMILALGRTRLEFYGRTATNKMTIKNCSIFFLQFFGPPSPATSSLSAPHPFLFSMVQCEDVSLNIFLSSLPKFSIFYQPSQTSTLPCEWKRNLQTTVKRDSIQWSTNTNTPFSLEDYRDIDACTSCSICEYLSISAT